MIITGVFCIIVGRLSLSADWGLPALICGFLAIFGGAASIFE
jgi:hypothetical protein